MTVEEFSNEFDALLNSYSSIEYGHSIELDEYEKSVFLTKAQEEILLELYSGKNVLGESLESTEEIRRYLSPLIKTTKASEYTNVIKGITPKSCFYTLPSDLWFITHEYVIYEKGYQVCEDLEYISVTPITQDEYHKIKKNPFRGSTKNRVLRLDAGESIVELVSEYPIDSYVVRYLSFPSPIILEDLPEDLKINKVSSKTECKLDKCLHKAILDRAVKIALVYRHK